MKSHIFTLLIIILLPSIVHADKGDIIMVKPIDCGPLAREEFGVVFSALEKNECKTFFVKGSAHDLCPTIMEAKELEGMTYDLCRDYTSPYPNECENIKEFRLNGNLKYNHITTRYL